MVQASSALPPTLKSWVSHSLLSLSFSFVRCKLNHLFLRCHRRGSSFLQDHLFHAHCALPHLSSSPCLTPSLQPASLLLSLPLPLTSYLLCLSLIFQCVPARAGNLQTYISMFLQPHPVVPRLLSRWKLSQKGSAT